MTNFLIIVGVLGLFFVPCVLMFAPCGADAKHRIVGSLVCICFWFLVAGGIYFQAVGNTERWNDGFCECGTHWELKGVTKTKNGSETKYYACPNCYTEIEIIH
jgi:hypothetical protein